MYFKDAAEEKLEGLKKEYAFYGEELKKLRAEPDFSTGKTEYRETATRYSSLSRQINVLEYNLSKGKYPER